MEENDMTKTCDTVPVLGPEATKVVEEANRQLMELAARLREVADA